MAIKLIVGLGNPGKDYQSHRHNVGFWFCDALANLHSATFKKEAKFFGDVAQASIAGVSVRLLKPTTFMNRSGQSIQALANFYQLEVDEILVVHDELDLEVGIAKLKVEGGHGGHNGLRDTIKALGSKAFYRLRLGIGHPGNKTQVADFVLHAPNKSELGHIQNALVDALQVIEEVVKGNIDQAMKSLHTKG
ncbi:aminoacyl-tRNA hydrolase [Candidatus Thioglobus sp.]|jgi:PTH1 family peptidyl-tRNA hydrolase|uniref:aminoacyl-tRNA hydrolase n=1 Tax=Candidatus Thioglobus sp. TaxID=2026721 RepID=UPI001D224DCE|nr:aminoacyl-tRNA hydrolase [Candidatus Thioglobus sp.]MBT3277483.1 aminoacyl-tRNA hydrolase [Candidatus Thioglobus sp.]MBT3447390.1 aminoacyl-tRNA hydrolase [Candidatus Thioglobus sp.]MBT3745053.1 aminoacyl-tRNA hydrolase [Candidatus Thioglobus sp.]MBT4000966.1 aminoacyl-tRNA hydrolase [Candidatus Thioglobus sp.]MBT4181502.1 aminoacyl-tRNA hydrolase [Candidatus Thioglobus sp.]